MEAKNGRREEGKEPEKREPMEDRWKAVRWKVDLEVYECKRIHAKADEDALPEP